MEAHLRLFLFAVLLTTGASLECEECSGETNCTGNMTVCAQGQDACAISLMETPEGSTLFKRCVSSQICNSGPIDVTFGKERFLRTNTACCMKDACNPEFPELPRLAEKYNGKVCPACYSSGMECPQEMMNCSGTEDHCLSFILIKGSGKNSVKSQKKGCCMASTCLTFALFGESLVPGYTISNVTCVLAKNFQVKKASPSSGFFLVVLLLVALFIAPWQ